MTVIVVDPGAKPVMTPALDTLTTEGSYPLYDKVPPLLLLVTRLARLIVPSTSTLPLDDERVRVLEVLQVTSNVQVMVPAQYGKLSATVAVIIAFAVPIVGPAVTVPALYEALVVVHPVGVAVVFHVGVHV